MATSTVGTTKTAGALWLRAPGPWIRNQDRGRSTANSPAAASTTTA